MLLQPARLVVPVVAHQHQRAEGSSLFHQPQQPAEHFVDVAGDDLLVHQVVEVAVGVAHLEVALVNPPAQPLVEQAADVLVVTAQRIACGPGWRLPGSCRPERSSGPLSSRRGCGVRPASSGRLFIRLPGVGQHVARNQAVAKRLVTAAARRSSCWASCGSCPAPRSAACGCCSGLGMKPISVSSSTFFFSWMCQYLPANS